MAQSCSVSPASRSDASQSFRASAGSRAASEGSASRQLLSKYFPLMPAASSETAQKMVLAAPCSADCGGRG